MLLFFIGLASCSRCAIFYSGTRYFYNYRFEADIYTIYNWLLNNGYNSKDIVLCAYNDIVTNAENPYRGKIFHETHHKTYFYPGANAIIF